MTDSVAIVIGMIGIISMLFAAFQITTALLYVAQAIKGLKNEDKATEKVQ